MTNQESPQEAERLYACFLEAVEAEDIEAAEDALAVLAESRPNVRPERLLFESLKTRRMLEDNSCVEHEVFLCPECFQWESLLATE